ncbi:methyltransferase domain-containing protein [bacterium]|nr:methyltransferase domain-containing protein [bacterium]
MHATPSCRHCHQDLIHSVVDLGVTPLANSYLKEDDLEKGETFFPLHVRVCGDCWLVQVPEFESREKIFTDYAYFSSFSDSWVEHARCYSEQMRARFHLNENSFVLELASNDGYLLKHFVAEGIPCMGIEPAKNVAAAAEQAGIPTLAEFFGLDLAERLVARGHSADLVVANNVLAQVPQLQDFVAGIERVLKEDGVVTVEFPHLLKTLDKNEFDTVYHEHFSYFSFHAVEKIFTANGIRLFDVEELPTHGGSIRIFGCRVGASHGTSDRVPQMKAREEAAGLLALDTYKSFHLRAEKVKRDLLRFLIDARDAGKKVVGYGAPAKGNTLLNFCGIKPDLLSFTVDKSPHKQGCFLPGSRIPVHAPAALIEAKPDYVLILPWNLADEIMQQTAFIRQWGGKFVMPIPELQIL